MCGGWSWQKKSLVQELSRVRRKREGDERIIKMEAKKLEGSAHCASRSEHSVDEGRNLVKL